MLEKKQANNFVFSKWDLQHMPNNVVNKLKGFSAIYILKEYVQGSKNNKKYNYSVFNKKFNKSNKC